MVREDRIPQVLICTGVNVVQYMDIHWKCRMKTVKIRNGMLDGINRLIPAYQRILARSGSMDAVRIVVHIWRQLIGLSVHHIPVPRP